MQQYVTFEEKDFQSSWLKIKIIEKLETVAILQENTAHSICNLKFNVPNKISVVFHNGSNYDYQFIIKEVWGTTWVS